jgi:poly(hydroxyalkanoate) depolymerase family esterase
MRRLNDTLTRLAALSARSGPHRPASVDRLTDLTGFGSNPGALGARLYVPDGLPEGAALVVVLHGCTQDAAGYDHGSGWSKLADQLGFAVLFPEQRRQNNSNLCFNWFNAQDTQRGSGEALSICQMIGTMIRAHRLDSARAYVTGLSAGGAMASVMLATYPELFAGGAIIAGLPYGIANSVPEAFDRMRAHGGPAPDMLADLVTSASTHGGPWPLISVWHGTNDKTVSPANAALIVAQWRTLHGAVEAPGRTVLGHARRVWHNADGREVIEAFEIAGLGHGTPLSTAGSDACGVPGPYMLEAGISSTRHIAAFWGLLDQSTSTRLRDTPPELEASHVEAAQTVLPPRLHAAPDRNAEAYTAGRIGATIENALRAAGLMR